MTSCTTQLLKLCHCAQYAIHKNIQSSDTTTSDFIGINSTAVSWTVTTVNSPEIQQLSVAQNCIHGLDEAGEDDQWLSGVVFDLTCPVN